MAPPTDDPTWYVSLRGSITPEARDALRRADIEPTGLSHATWMGNATPQESHSVYVKAASAAAAVEKAETALAGLGVGVNADSVKQVS